MTASCSILLAVGQAIFQASLTSRLLRIVSEEEADMLIAAGAADVNAAIRPANRIAVVDAYNRALTDVFVSPDSPADIPRADADALSSSFPPLGPLLLSCWSAVSSGRTSRAKLSSLMRKATKEGRKRRQPRTSKARSHIVCSKQGCRKV